MRPINKKKPVPPPTKPKPNIHHNGNKENSSKEPVLVFARLRPIKNIIDQVSLRKVAGSDKLLQLTESGCSQQIYEFKQVFDEHCSQKDVFDAVAFPLVQDLINGNNGLIFTYGVTSSGKTHTITGTPSNCGILPRTLDTLFNSLDRNELQSIKYVFKPDGQNGFEIASTPDALLKLQSENNITIVQQQQNKQFMTPGKFTTYSNSNVPRTPRSTRKNYNGDQLELWENRQKDSDQFVSEINCDNNFAVFVSYVEVYNNYIYDLLDDSFDQVRANGDKKPRPKNIREDSKKKVFVVGVTEVEVKSANEAFELFIKGIRRRRMGTTQLNSESSRSHSVFTVRLTQAPLDLNGTELLENKDYIHVSQLSIVDLAGCERTARTQATGNRLKEASNINNSLMNLRNCFDILRENQKTNSNKMVPYRDNKLTHLFKSYFEGDGKVEMVICVNPGQEDLDETLQVLKFAEISQEITTTAIKGGVSRFPFQQQQQGYCTNMAYELAPINSLGPPYPDRYLEDPEDGSILAEWMDCISKRIANQQMNNEINRQNQMTVRQHIVELEQTAMVTQQKLSVAQMDLDAREHQLKEYENKFVQMERENETLKKRVVELERANGQQFEQISLKERICSQLQNELEQLRITMSDRLREEKDRLKRWCIRLMREKQQELEREKCIEQDKIARVKQILDGGAGDQDLFATYSYLTSPPRAARQQPTPSGPRHTRRSSPESASNGPKTRSHSNDHQNQVGLNAPLSPTQHAPPVANPRHRRSLSAGGEKWIDHRPPGTLELGTILRPKLKNKKSVTNLKASDFIDNVASKYALTHHEATDSGTVETKVFKGEVIPSSTGGAQIIFNDVETLKQNSPTSIRKRYGGGGAESNNNQNGCQSSSKQHQNHREQQQQQHPISSRDTTPGTHRSGRSRSHQVTPCSNEPMSELHQFLSKRSRQH